MRTRTSLVGFLIGLVVVCATGCEKSGDSASNAAESRESPAKTAPLKARGIDSIADVPALLGEALEVGARTWPGAEVGGVKIGEEVPPGAHANTYSLRVSFEFDTDPSDATAKSGSVVCSPACQVIRHEVQRAPAAPFPCAFGDALAVARGAGVKGERPVVAYGYWNFDGRTGWTFRDDADGPVVEIGEGCEAKTGAAPSAP